MDLYVCRCTYIRWLPQPVASRYDSIRKVVTGQHGSNAYEISSGNQKRKPFNRSRRTFKALYMCASTVRKEMPITSAISLFFISCR